MTVPLRRVDENVWMIPKEAKACMKVPVIIYADDFLINKMKEDLTLVQAMNVACLKGIQKYSLVMPDGHQGYGFPVGGVAAMAIEEDGVISPGGIGYDINCLPPGTRVLTRFGYRIPIEELRRGGQVVSIGKGGARSSRVKYFMWRYEDKLIRIRTKSGYTIQASPDHPILTRDGMKEAALIRKGELVALHPFEGVDYEEPEDFVILTEDMFPKGIARELKRRGLLPLTSKHPKLPILVKLLAYFTGDGSFNGGSGKMTVFYGSPEGLEEVRRDIEELGYKPSKVRVRVKRVERDGKLYITTEYSVAVSARSFKELLIALGAPRGRKVYEAYRVPGWLKRMPRWVKRLYLAALFGAELNKPQIINGYNFEPPLLSITKSVELEEAGLRFLEDIAGMLEELGVKVTGINKVVEGSGVRLRLQILAKPENLIKLWSTIGYEYNPERRRLALAAVVWLKYKVSVLAERKAVEALAVALRKAGFPKSQVVEVLVSDYVNGRFVERSLYEGRREEPRIAYNLPAFEEWVSSRLEGDIVWDEVEDVITVPYNGLVYDITVDDEAHNFVAEGVVVSNCGVRVIRTDLTVKEVRPRIKELVDEIYRNVPSGVGSTGKVRLSVQELDRVLNEGVEWALGRGYGWSDDIELIEQRGSWDLADANAVSRTAKQRGAEQLGTLGSGNHFLEVQVVDRVYDEEIAKVYGLFEGQIVVMIHTGSRGLGHQVASDYLVVMERAMRAYGTIPPDRELASVPWSSREAQNYLRAMAAAANFAWTNRQMIAHWTRESFKKVFHVDPDKIGMRIVYDVAHNIAKIEEYDVEGRRMKLVIHRKGATRAFPPGSPEIPVKYRSVGQPVLIPGSMGTASYILAGIPEGVKSWYTAPHGAGRWMSRAAAKRKRSFRDVVAELESKGIYIKASNIETVVEETPEAYKDVDKVAEVADAVGIAKLVARMKPIGVTKG